MTQEKKPARTLELSVDIDAPLEAAWKAITEGPGLANWFPPMAAVTKPGIDGEVTFKWSESMAMTVKVDAWEPGKHVRWIDESGWLGAGTVLTTDYYLSTEGGKTRVRLVQSGFGESEAWDDFFGGTEIGWTYFLYNLRVYLEKHLGRVRRMVADRFEVAIAREAFWKYLTSTAAGLIVGGTGAVKVGDWVQLKLTEPATARAVVELVIEGHALAFRLADLKDSLLFIEVEMGKDSFGVGFWLSVYDDGIARDIEAPAKRAFDRIKAALPKN